MLMTIQGLRAVATLVVAFTHIDQVMNHLDHTRIGDRAFVVLFFVLSGFIMVYKCHGKAMAPLSFMMDRIHRCVPLYWTLTLAVFALAAFVPAATQATKPDLVQFVKSLLFIPFVKANGLVQPVLYVGWTLNYEMMFYLLFAIALLARNRTTGLVLCMATILAVVCAGQFVPDAWPVLQFLTSARLLMFVLGMAVALVYVRRGRAAARMPRLLAEVVLVVALVSLVVFPLALPWGWEALTGGLPAVLALGAGLSLEGRGSWLSTAWMGRLGDASYSIYLSHTFVLELFARAAARLHMSGIALALVQLACLVTIAVVGLLLRQYLERPLGRLAGRALWAGRSRRPATV